MLGGDICVKFCGDMEKDLINVLSLKSVQSNLLWRKQKKWLKGTYVLK